MKKIKSILSIVLCVSLLTALTIPSFAATLDQNSPSGEAKVVYKAGQTTDDKGTEDPSDDVVSGTYTVSIPEYIEAAAQGETPTAYDVTAQDVLIPYATSLNVSVNFDNTLKLADNTATVIAYDLQANGASVSTGATILTVAAGNPDAATTSTVAAVLTQAPSYSGVYSNTATFSVAVA